MKFKTMIATTAAALGILAAAPVAQAAPLTNAEQDYINALYYAGFGNYSAGQALLLGYMACESPLSRDAQVDAVYANTNANIDYMEASLIVDAAHYELCPVGVAL